MVRIVKKEKLAPLVYRIEVEAPLVARHALAGQFVIVRAGEEGERIPLTVAGCDREKGLISLIFQAVGGSTYALAAKREGEFLADVAGPLGRPSAVEGIGRAAVVGGGVGCAIALPVAARLHELGARVVSVAGFRSREYVLLEREFGAVSDRLIVTTDDGSYGEKGNVCVPLARLLREERFDAVFAVGPLVMMKFVAETTRPFGIKTIASMNPIMIDGTGMCGCCRLSVGGETKFACVDGPEFDAHLIDFDEAIARSRTYAEFERVAREKNCNLLKGVE